MYLYHMTDANPLQYTYTMYLSHRPKICFVLQQCLPDEQKSMHRRFNILTSFEFMYFLQTNRHSTVRFEILHLITLLTYQNILSACFK